MRVAVFGAAGRTGTHVVRQALERGHDVTAFVRDPGDLGIDDPRLTVVVGDARNPAAVEEALTGRDAVISVLALTSAEREPEYSEATATIVDAAKRLGVRRVIATANNDVLTDREVTGEYAAHAREHRRNRAIVQSSGSDWTIGAAPWVTDDPPLGAYDAALDERGPGKRIGTVDLARFTLDALESDEWIGHIVGVSSG